MKDLAMTQKITPSHSSPKTSPKPNESGHMLLGQKVWEQFVEQLSEAEKQGGDHNQITKNFLTQHGLEQNMEKGHASLHLRVKPVTD
ncbi:MAG: hypothetical protein HN531_15565 [Opitutae bacterium]|jgi:hypothetical protein|nr:hypothetical protein [Opitutae bacterium]